MVKRYAHRINQRGGFATVEPVPHPTGVWVDYDDYAALEARLAKLDAPEAREAIAKVIHPVGFEENSLELVSVVQVYKAEALRKADAILALLKEEK